MEARLYRTSLMNVLGTATRQDFAKCGLITPERSFPGWTGACSCRLHNRIESESHRFSDVHPSAVVCVADVGLSRLVAIVLVRDAHCVLEGFYGPRHVRKCQLNKRRRVFKKQ